MSREQDQSPQRGKKSPQRGTLSPRLVAEVRQLVEAARREVVQTVNSTMVQTYWHIGRLIVEDEQQGEVRAAYGKRQLQQLSETLTAEFGKGFDVRNLRNMRAFYQSFPIRNALRTELSWTHYRVLLRVESDEARRWYRQEAIEQGWSARALERQIGKLYYERLLSSRDRAAVQREAQEHTQALAEHGLEHSPARSPKHYLRTPTQMDSYIRIYDRQGR